MGFAFRQSCVEPGVSRLASYGNTTLDSVFPAENDAASERLSHDSVRVFNLDLAPLSLVQMLEQVDRMVEIGEPSFVITANLNYAMLTGRDPRLERVNRDAAFILADGMPLVWAARLAGTPLPGRTTGSDLVPALCSRAAERGYRVFLLGSTPETAQAAASVLRKQLPRLNIVGSEQPAIDRLDREETQALVERVRATRPDILLAALGQPKGEIWLADHCQDLGAPLAIQIGGSLEFVAGHVPRAPRWMQRTGLEWFYRLYQEPRRLWRRYADNALFLLVYASRRLLRFDIPLTSPPHT
jgi:N-acetylglucosaminyldiphosphoundecaprenol N-acetyl-beta-D-mannosaminyltransferase